MKALVGLQNGSDIRGVAIETPEFSVNLTTEAMTKIASGLIHWLNKKGGNTNNRRLKIGVGRDSRLSGEALKEALVTSLIAQGVDVVDFGLATTPAMFMSTQFPQFACDAGIMLTASHLPYYYNGVKIFSQSGGAEHEDIEEITSNVATVESLEEGERTTADLITPYAQDLVDKIRQGIENSPEKPLSGLKIIVDAGNGAGGFFAEKVLQPLGADTNGSQFLEPDGSFPNHIPNPDNQEAMESIQQAVIREKADLGVIFDTDVDRSAVVTKTGDVLNRNNLIAVLSRIILAEHPGTSIVTNSPTTDHLKVFIEKLGGKQVRYISGYRNVINKSMELNENGIDSQLAIETSGHAAFKENYFLDDGAYVIAKILMLLPQLEASGESLVGMIEELQQPVETQEVRFKLEVKAYRALGEQIIADLATIEEAGWSVNPENDEGIRFKLEAPYGSGWFLLRMSLHEPLLVLQVENDQAGFILPVLKRLQVFFDEYSAVNQEKLMSLLK